MMQDSLREPGQRPFQACTEWPEVYCPGPGYPGRTHTGTNGAFAGNGILLLSGWTASQLACPVESPSGSTVRGRTFPRSLSILQAWQGGGVSPEDLWSFPPPLTGSQRDPARSSLCSPPNRTYPSSSARLGLGLQAAAAPVRACDSQRRENPLFPQDSHSFKTEEGCWSLWKGQWQCLQSQAAPHPQTSFKPAS